MKLCESTAEPVRVFLFMDEVFGFRVRNFPFPLPLRSEWKMEFRFSSTGIPAVEKEWKI